MDFIDDKEKMRDYFCLSKTAFLSCYNTITEQDYEETTRVVNGIRKVSAEDEPELTGQIIDIFEDFLDFEKQITLPNEERDYNETLCPEESANIYGHDYDYLAEHIKKTFERWGIIASEE
jgi:hypothetical protein